MGKNSKAKPVKVKDPERSARVRRVVLHTLAVVILLSTLVLGVDRIKAYVDRNLVADDRPPRVVIKNRPSWMSDALAGQIVQSIQPDKPSSPFDKQLLVDTVNMLSRNPWIKATRSVRRAYGRRPGDTLEIDCDFRAPIALVKWRDYYWLIDSDAIKLPQQFTEQQLPTIIRGNDGRLNIRVIEGVSEAPVQSGNKWNGDDLAAGIELVKLLFGHAFTEEIVRVDVSNFGGRVNPRNAQLALVTRYDTTIQWGLPINTKDFFVEIPTDQKLKRLEQIWAQYKRVDAGMKSIDIRLEVITHPSTENAAAQTNAGR